MGLVGNFGTSLTLLLAHLSLFRAHREHKVHNIVLYPDKESWCKTTPIKQVVTWPQCSSQELDNNVCVGACFSYMVPHSEPSAPGDLIRPYCDSCQPLDSIWHTVTLDCKDKDDNPTTMQKKVQIITNCSCSSCMESSRIKPDFNSLLQSLELESTRLHHHGQQQQQQHNHHHNHHLNQQQQQVPQDPLQESEGPSPAPESSPAVNAAGAGESPSGGLAAPPLPSPVSPSPAAAEPTEAPDTSAAAAAASVATPNAAAVSAGGVHETPDLLLDPNLQGSAAAAAASGPRSNERLMQLFKQLKDPNLGGTDRLEKLSKLKGLEKLEKLEKLATEYPTAKEFLAKLSELLHKYSNQEDLEPLDNDEDGSEDLLRLPGSLAPSPPPSAAQLPPELHKDEDDEEVPSLQDQQLRVAASLLHRTGPHHSLVLDSGVKEKIDVESHYLHPALAGQEISYNDNGLLGAADKTKKKDF